MIYADYNATAPVLPEVREAMLPWLEEGFGNPASTHYPAGRAAAAAVESAREQLAQLLGSDPDEVVFTSGGTESCFLALTGAALIRRAPLLISAAEHPAVREAARFLLDAGLITSLQEIGLSADGSLCVENLPDLESPPIVSVMAANNETGVIFDPAPFSALLRQPGVVFHTDAVQLLGKELLSICSHPAQLFSLSGHKIGAPKGVGALVIKRGTPWRSPIPGGGQESARRGGTVPVAQVVGFGAAAAVAFKQLARADAGFAPIRDAFEQRIAALLPESVILGRSQKRLANTSSVLIPGSVALGVIQALGDEGICISAGSACSSTHAEPSHVLTAMGLTPFDALATLRVSFGARSSVADALVIADALAAAVKTQRARAEEVVQRKLSRS